MIMEAAREMLHDQDLPMHLWAKAARTTVYVHNPTPHRVLDNKTPKETFSSEKPEVSHLRKFGWFPSVHTHSKGQKNEVRLFRKEGHICGI